MYTFAYKHTSLSTYTLCNFHECKACAQQVLNNKFKTAYVQ